MSSQKQFPPGLVFSFDLESSGLLHEAADERPYLLETAFVPMDIHKRKIYKEKALHLYHQCPDLETMKQEGKVSDFVLGNENILKVIGIAHKKGQTVEKTKEAIHNYFETFRTYSRTDESQAKGTKKAVLFGKSIAGLDRPLLAQVYGQQWVEDLIFHEMLDLVSAAQFLIHINSGIVSSVSSNKLIKELLGTEEEIPHTALEDAFLLGKVYLEMMNRSESILKSNDS
ncbi:MAG: hypothetical protein HRU19_15965 [Pseudobacteriovorax sp.]|nr:hypothetical protein [Pseudobacteriovorax sp.]